MKKLPINLISKKLKNDNLQTNKGFIHTPKSFCVCLREKRGFTLVETLIAITILTVAILGPITLASKGLFSAMFARDQITAFYLAQEAVEFIRNKRDSNNITGSNWLAGLNTCSNGTSCFVDIKNNSINNCPIDVCPALKYDENNNFYNYATGVDSNFTRKVKLEAINSKESSITVTMLWRTGIGEKTFTVKENILNWQNNQN